MKPFAVLALLAFAAAGCGGGSTVTATIHTRAAAKRCIESTMKVTHFPAISDDFVASTASGGSLRVPTPDNAVTVLFAQSAEEANNLADAYRRFHAKNVGVEDVLRTKDNVVMLWQLHPSALDESHIEDCLK